MSLFLSHCFLTVSCSEADSLECHTKVYYSINRVTKESAWLIHTCAYVHFMSSVWYLCFLCTLLAIGRMPAHFTHFGITVYFFVAVFSSFTETNFRHCAVLYICVWACGRVYVCFVQFLIEIMSFFVLFCRNKIYGKQIQSRKSLRRKQWEMEERSSWRGEWRVDTFQEV
jgi:hypothetical protein